MGVSLVCTLYVCYNDGKIGQTVIEGKEKKFLITNYDPVGNAE